MHFAWKGLPERRSRGGGAAIAILRHKARSREAKRNAHVSKSLGLAIAGLLFLLGSGVSFAVDIPRLPGKVTDLTSARVLAAGASQMDQAIRRLADERSVDLFVLFVDTTADRTVGDYAGDVFRANSLGENDALFVVAVADRSYWLELDTVSTIDPAAATQLRSRNIEPRLRAADWTGAVVATADGLRGAIAGSPGSVQQPPVPTGDSGFAVRALVVVALLIGGFWALTSFTSSRRAQAEAKRTADERDQRTGELARAANAALLKGDDALHDAEQELAFAEAQFGESEVLPYREAVKTAGTEMKAAFAIRQRLDDETPEDPATRESMLRELLDHTAKAQATLDEQRDRIEKLRDLERRAPEILAQLPEEISATEARLQEAKTTLRRLMSYAPSSWNSVKGNVAEAEKRLAFARAQLDTQGNVADKDKQSVPRRVRLAQEAVAQAQQLLDAVEALARSVEDAEQRIASELQAARTDVAAAHAAVRPGGNGFHAKLAQAESALQQAERLAGAPQPDVLGAMRFATQANSLADEVLANVREAEAQRVREAQQVESLLRQADAGYQRAADYIIPRRAGVRREARTRLAESRSHLEQALSLSGEDPRAAAAEAQRAISLADEAYRLAEEDFDSYDDAGGMFGGGRRGGGIFPPIIIGGWGGGFGGNRGGGFGGTPWGQGGGGFGGGASGGGGFGGGGRSGGGRF